MIPKPIVLLALGFLLLVSPGSAAPVEAPPADSLSSVLDDLRGVEVEMSANQESLDGLRRQLAELQTQGRKAGDEMAKLQALVDAHAARVEQLSDRYAKTLELTQRLKHDLERAQGWNLALGTAAAVAVVVAVVEGWALLSH